MTLNCNSDSEVEVQSTGKLKKVWTSSIAFKLRKDHTDGGLLGQKPLRGAGYQHFLGGGQYLIIANAEAHLDGRLNDQRLY